VGLLPCFPTDIHESEVGDGKGQLRREAARHEAEVQAHEIVAGTEDAMRLDQFGSLIQ